MKEKAVPGRAEKASLTSFRRRRGKKRSGCRHLSQHRAKKGPERSGGLAQKKGGDSSKPSPATQSDADA